MTISLFGKENWQQLAKGVGERSGFLRSAAHRGVSSFGRNDDFFFGKESERKKRTGSLGGLPVSEEWRFR
jgi:hypothetical protein